LFNGRDIYSAAQAGESQVNRYVAFLRGINVGGHKLIKMDQLVRIFTDAGFKNVRTYIQCGNVIFESRSANKASLTKKIEKALRETLGYEVTVVLRTLSELESIVTRNPFKRRASGTDVMQCVVFLADEPVNKKQIPIISTTENLEVFEVADGAVFTIARRKKNGWFGFPNNFVEKQFGVAGTTRQWSTVNKILKAAQE
jgi:uncharacterized protein (DUF1697 family)